WGTAVFTQDEIDLYDKYVDHDLVKLCIDTAHTALAGMDPVKTIERYGKRIGYMHLKDLDPDTSICPERPLKRFLPLGCGTIDFSGVYKELVKQHYDGVLCVELDDSAVCNYKSALISRQYIHNVLHL
ncbi:MAG: sugar phosphate isomerase/epimerase, partial [Treponema sp.]|nr:sugar phosphate isomerase/epimerase [Treponema sp.]